MKYTPLFALLASVALSGCLAANTSTQSVTSAEKQSGLFGLGEKDALNVDTAAAFKDVKKVVIGGFIVGFDMAKTESSKAGGGLFGSGFGGKSTAALTLNGIDNAALQAITDKAYEDFTAQLKAKGYEIVERKQLLEHEDFKDVKTYEHPYEDDQSTLLTSGTLTRYFNPSSFGDKLYVFMGDVAGLTGGFGFGNPTMGAVGFAEDTKIPVLHVSYRIDFANADKHGGFATNSSWVNVGQGLSVKPEATKIGIIGGQMGTFSSAVGNITLGQPVNSDKSFATVDDTTSEVSEGVQMATNVVGLLGGIGSNISREYVVNARPADYSAASLDALSQTSKAFTDKMQSLK